ncbi:hypothetical protein VTK26DRAFT_5442 [Humicola hyalothermophila]
MGDPGCMAVAKTPLGRIVYDLRVTTAHACKHSAAHHSKFVGKVPLFTDPDAAGPDADNGDFTASTKTMVCEHAYEDELGPDLVAVMDSVMATMEQFRPFWDNIGVGLPDGLPRHEFRCPNLYIANEYHPLGRLVVDGRTTATWRPYYPVDFLYSPGAVAGESDAGLVGQGSLRTMRHDRSEVEELGWLLWRQKCQTKRLIPWAEAGLDSLERTLASVLMGQQYTEDTSDEVLAAFDLAGERVRKVKYVESEAAKWYQDMMRHTGLVLRRLGRMPAEGESAVSADGSYSVTRKELDLAEESLETAIRECDGPLKQAGVLQARLVSLKDILRSHAWRRLGTELWCLETLKRL